MITPQALIIDDNRFNIDVLIFMFSQEGVRYASVESPRYMPQVLDEMESVDVVFLDLEFPNGSGVPMWEI